MSSHDRSSGAGRGPLRGTHVLIIEDETNVASLLEDFLQARGCRVTVEHDGRDGSEAFQRIKPDMVVTDLLVPSRNGFQLVEEFEGIAPETPVVAMSGLYKLRRYRDELAHAKLFIEKPLNLEKLELIADVLAAHVAEHGPTERDEPPADEAPGSDETPAAAEAPAHQPVPRVPVTVLPLARCLQLLLTAERTGTLSVETDGWRIRFWLRDGQVLSLHCDDATLGVGRALLDAGQVTPEQLQAAADELSLSPCSARIGQALLEAEVITAADLTKAIRWATRQVIFRAFGAIDASTVFHAGEDEECAHDGVPARMNARAMILRGCAGRQEDSPGLLAHLPDPTTPLRLSEEAETATLELPAAVLGLVDQLKRPRTLSEVLAMLRVAGTRPAPLVHGLLCAGVLEVAAEVGDWQPHEPRVHGRVRKLKDDAPPLVQFLELSRARATGTLTLRDSEGTAWLGLRDGEVRCAGSDDARARIGQRLKQAGLIDDAQLSAALEAKARAPRALLGRLLVEMGFLESHQLLDAARSQVAVIANEMLCRATWKDARFAEGRVDSEEPLGLGKPGSDVVMQALRALPRGRLEELAVQLGRSREAPSPEALATGGFQLTEGERAAAEEALGGSEGPSESDEDQLRVLVAALLVTPELAALSAPA